MDGERKREEWREEKKKKGIRFRSRLDLWSFKEYGMGMSSTPRAVVSRGNLGWVGESHRDGSTGTVYVLR
jgi:hypothetical protein